MSPSNECCSHVTMFLAWLSFVTFCLYAAGFASPTWLAKDYDLPNPFNPLGPPTTVKSIIGLVWACTDIGIFNINTQQTDSDEKCETLTDIDVDMVKDWQWACAGMGIGALVCVFLCLVLACHAARRKQRDTGLRFAIICFYIMAGGLLVASLVMFHKNKDWEIKTPIFTHNIDYEFGWGFYVSAASAGLFFLNAILNIVVRLLLPPRGSGSRPSTSSETGAAKPGPE